MRVSSPYIAIARCTVSSKSPNLNDTPSGSAGFVISKGLSMFDSFPAFLRFADYFIPVFPAVPESNGKRPVNSLFSPCGGLQEPVSGIQDSVAFTFKKFGDLLHLISLNAHFIQRFAKVPKKRIEMPVV